MVSKKYTGDYGLENVLDKNGKLKTVSVYKGPYFRFSAPAETLKRAKVLFPVLSLLGAAASVIPLLLSTELMRRWYISIPAILCFLSAVLLLTACWHLLAAREAVRREDKDKIHDRFALWSVLLGGFSVLSLIGQIVFFVRSDSTLWDLAVLLCTLLQLVCAALLFAGKKAVLMEQVPSE